MANAEALWRLRISGESTWDVPRVIVQTLAKMSSQWFSPNQWMDSSPTWWADSHYYWAQFIGASDGGTPFACVRGT